MTSPLTDEEAQQLQDLAHKLRIHSIESTNACNSGHPTSCASIAEIMSVLFFRVMQYSIRSPRDPASDRFVLSKGHAAPILYAAWAEAGLFPVAELLKLRKLDSDLEGHPTPRLPFVDVATGSLGQGLSVACGMAYVGKYVDRSPYRVYCVLGDGETAEGSVWEAVNFAAHYRLDNLCAILDVNRLGQSEPTMLQHRVEAYAARLCAFGWETTLVDGHDVRELSAALQRAAATEERPTAIVAKTFKGKHLLELEDAEGWHGKALGKEADRVLEHLRGLMRDARVKASVREPPAGGVPTVNLAGIRLSSPPKYEPGEKVATRMAYGTALRKLVEANDRVLAFDADTKNSTFSDKVRKDFPANHVECFIAEQNMVGVAIGAACRERAVSFASTFATFFTRAFDQIRMGAISRTNANFVGSHCGVSIGEDGPSQMGLEDVAMFRTVPGATVFYPSDAVSAERAVELAANTAGVCFVRTTRAATPTLYCADAEFAVGRACVVRQSPEDAALVVACGVTLAEAVAAHDTLRRRHATRVRVLDPFTLKPLDAAAVVAHAAQCADAVVTVEDHYGEGGLGEAVLAACAERPVRVRVLAVRGVPRSGKPEQLLRAFGIDADAIVEAVLQLVGAARG